VHAKGTIALTEEMREVILKFSFRHKPVNSYANQQAAFFEPFRFI